MPNINRIAPIAASAASEPLASMPDIPLIARVWAGDSVRGGERTYDANKRIRPDFDTIVELTKEGDMAIVAHGAAGTL